MNAKVIGITVLLAALCVFMMIMTYDSATGDIAFAKAGNIENLLRRTAMYGILGIGVALVIISSGIDLSIGSVVCLSGCLLAIFLSVTYTPFEGEPIAQVRGADKTIVLKGDVALFKPGDRIRYWGGRRAGNAVVNVTAVKPGVSSDGGVVTEITVDQALSGDDTYGQVAKVYAVTGATDTDATVTIRGAHADLAARDQITLAHPKSGLRQLTITGVTVDSDSTTLTVNEKPGGVTNEWVATLLERNQYMSIPLALLSVLGIAIGLGLIHGLLITKMKMQPFVVTLCGLLIYRGLSREIAKDQPVGFYNEFTDTLSPLATGKVTLWTAADGTSFGIPYPFFIMAFLMIAAMVFLNRTIWGRYLLALGRNEQAARYSGINTDRVVIVAYVICTALAGAGGMLFALDANSISPSSFGNFFELYAIAAAVLGGCSLRGGEGTIIGVVIGTAVMQVLYTLTVMLKISDRLEYTIIGAVLLLGVLADEVFKRLAAKRRAVLQARAAQPE